MNIMSSQAWEQSAESSPEITVQIEGSALTEFYPAERVGIILLAVESLLSAALKAASPEDFNAEKLALLARFPRRGSYIQELVPIWNIATDLANKMPALIPLLPDAMNQLTYFIDLLKEILPLFASKEQPSISLVGNKGTVLINSDIHISDIHIHIDQLQGAANIAESVTEIAAQLGSGLTKVQIQGADRELAITENDVAALGNRYSKRAAKRLAKAVADIDGGSELAEREPVDATVDILSFDKHRRSGTLSVVDSDGLPTRRFRFDLADRPETKDAIVAMLQSRVRVVCRLIDVRKLELLSVAAEPE